MFDPNNEADWDMAEANASASLAAAGVCVICEVPLDPCHPRWNGQFDTRRVLREVEGKRVVVTEPWSAEQESARNGPVLDWAGDRHKACYDDMIAEGRW